MKIISISAPSEDLSGVKIEDDDRELELQVALKKAQRVKLALQSGVEKVAQTIKQEVEDTNDNQAGNIVLNATAEFCRTLGDIPTYGLAGNREEDVEDLMVIHIEDDYGFIRTQSLNYFQDFEAEGIKEKLPEDEEDVDGRGAWNTVKIGIHRGYFH